MADDSRRLRNRFVDAPGSVGARARARRWEQFQRVIPDIEKLRVIDLGGRAEMWIRAPFQPAHVHLVNLEEQPAELPDWITAEVRDVTKDTGGEDEQPYDLAFSNSVIEHVGGYANRTAFAQAVGRLAPRHWVQTPYRYFPVEPHWLFPGFQFLPVSARAEISRRWPLVHTRSPSHAAGVAAAMGVELLSRTEMAAYFPDSALRYERVAGVVKALIAVKKA